MGTRKYFEDSSYDWLYVHSCPEAFASGAVVHAWFEVVESPFDSHLHLSPYPYTFTVIEFEEIEGSNPSVVRIGAGSLDV